MSIKVMTRVWESSKAKEGAFIVLLAVADFSNDNGVAFPSMKVLARKARMTVRNAQLAVRRLERMGELNVTIGAAPAPYTGCNLFRVTLVTGVQETLLRGEIKRPLGVKPTSSKPSVPINKPSADFSITTTGYVYDPADYEGYRRWKQAAK